MPLSVDISAIGANTPIAPSQPADGVTKSVAIAASRATIQEIADVAGGVVAGGTHDGLSFSYSAVDREVTGVNTDKGSTAVSAHVALADPHPQYSTAADVAAAFASHIADPDPHGVYLKKSGGVVSGALTVNATLEADNLKVTGVVEPITVESGNVYNLPGVLIRPVATFRPADYDFDPLSPLLPSTAGAMRLRTFLNAGVGTQVWELYPDAPVPNGSEFHLYKVILKGPTIAEDIRIPVGGSLRLKYQTLDTLSDPGLAGEVSYDNNYLNVAIGTSAWRRLAFAGGGGALSLLSDVVLTAPLSGQVLSYDGTNWVNATPSGGGGPVDHGTTTGLGDDDHPQYHNDARGDARYSLLAHTHSDATTSVSGFMSAADKTKLNGVEAGATADMTGAEIVSAIDAQLGGTTWQGGGGGGGPTTLRLAADVTTTGSAFIDVAGLQTTLAANTTYLVEGYILVQSNAAGTASPRVGWLFGTQVVWGSVNITADVSTAGVTVRTGHHTSNENSRTGHVGNLATTTVATDRPALVKITAMFRTTATPGVIGVTLASEAAGATVVRVLADSFLLIRQVV